MSLDSQRPTRGGSSQDLWPKWMWVAVPVLVVVVVAGLWWAIFSEPDTTPTPTPTPTMKIIPTQPTRSPTKENTLVIETEATRGVLPSPATFTPTPLVVVTPTAAAVASEPAVGLGVGAKAKVTAGAGLNMRAGAGTGHARIKTLPKGSVVEVIGGPKEANDYTWWQVRDEAGATGWVVSAHLSTGKE